MCICPATASPTAPPPFIPIWWPQPVVRLLSDLYQQHFLILPCRTLYLLLCYFLSASLVSTIRPLPPSLVTFPITPLPRPLSLCLSFPLRTISMPLCAQDRSALITLMAMMIQLNGALLPPVPLQGHSAASSYQQHSARDRGLGSVLLVRDVRTDGCTCSSAL